MPNLHHVAMWVHSDEVELSLRFYREGLGLELIMDVYVSGEYAELFDVPYRRLRSIMLGDRKNILSGIFELVVFDQPTGTPPGSAPRPLPETTTPSRFLLNSFFVDFDEVLPRLQALYVQFRSNMDEGEARISDFVATVSERLARAPPRNAVVDLRFDTGGDCTENRELMRQIANRVPGKIYVLVGNYTFSAGIAAAAALAHDGGTRVTIVGSEMGDRTHWWSERARAVCLPTSHVCMPVNSGFWDIANGCGGQGACYSDQFDLRLPSTARRLHAPLTSVAWLEDRDPGLEAIESDLLQ